MNVIELYLILHIFNTTYMRVHKCLNICSGAARLLSMAGKVAGALKGTTGEFRDWLFESLRLRNKSNCTYLLSIFYRNMKLEYFIYFYIGLNYISYE